MRYFKALINDGAVDMIGYNPDTVFVPGDGYAYIAYSGNEPKSSWQEISADEWNQILNPPNPPA